MDNSKQQADSSLTLDDLYGTSRQTAAESTTQPESDIPPKEDLVYEETPIIEPIDTVESNQSNAQNEGDLQNEQELPATEDRDNLPNPPEMPKLSTQTPVQIPDSASAPQKGREFLKTVVILILLFSVGIGVSVIIRRIVPTDVTLPSAQVEQQAVISPEPVSSDLSRISPAEVNTAGWSTIHILRSGTKQELPNVSLKLPPDVLSPICDGSQCSSQGTYLPGGTRLTVAAYTRRSTLSGFIRTIITDAAGRSFETHEASVSGMPAQEFTGTFAGSTTGGYRFSEMRGYMIRLDDSTMIEINHFTPTGISADFQSDDALFEKITQTIELSAIPTIPPTRSAEPSNEPG